MFRLKWKIAYSLPWLRNEESHIEKKKNGGDNPSNQCLLILFRIEEFGMLNICGFVLTH